MSKQKKKTLPNPAAVKDLPPDKPAYNWDKFIYIILPVFAFLLYANTLHHEYALDDYAAISGNEYTQQGFKGIHSLMTTDLFDGINNHSVKIEGGRYRPLTLVSYAIEYQFFGLNPHVSHLINVLLYAIIALVLYRTLITMFPAMPRVALAATLLFIAHPVHTEVVANIKSRDELFSFLWLMLLMLYLFKYAHKNKIIYMVYSGIAFFLSLLAKENAIIFLVIIPLALYFFTSLPAKKIAYLTLPFLLIFAGYYVLRTSFVGAVVRNPTNEFATVMCIFGKYLLLLFYPVTLSSNYNYNEVPIVAWSSWKAFVPAVIYLSMLVYAIKVLLQRFQQRRKGATSDIQASSIIAFGIFFFIIAHFLVSNVLFTIGATMGERFLFLPSLGFCLVIAVLINKVTRSDIESQSMLLPVPSAIVLGVILVLFSVRTVSRNPDWKTNFTLFSADVHNAPNCAKLHYDYGNELYNKAMNPSEDAAQKLRDLSQAQSETMRAIEIDPNYFEAYYNLGQIYEQEGNADSSIYYLKIAIGAKPDYANAYSALGTVFGRMKAQYDSAIYYLKTAVMLNDKFEGAFENLGLAYYMKHDLANAIPNLEKAVELQPQDAKQIMNLSIIYGLQGNKEKAQMYYERAVAIDPSFKK